MIDPKPITGPYFWVRVRRDGKPPSGWEICQLEDDLWWPINGGLASDPKDVEVGPEINPPC